MKISPWKRILILIVVLEGFSGNYDQLGVGHELARLPAYRNGSSRLST